MRPLRGAQCMSWSYSLGDVPVLAGLGRRQRPAVLTTSPGWGKHGARNPAGQHCRDWRSGKAYKGICAQWAQQQPIAPGKAIGPELLAASASTAGLRHRDPIAAGNRR